MYLSLGQKSIFFLFLLPSAYFKKQLQRLKAASVKADVRHDSLVILTGQEQHNSSQAAQILQKTKGM